MLQIFSIAEIGHGGLCTEYGGTYSVVSTEFSSVKEFNLGASS